MICAPNNLTSLAKEIQSLLPSSSQLLRAESTYLPLQQVDLEGEAYEKANELLEAVEALDDVVQVYSNLKKR